MQCIYILTFLLLLIQHLNCEEKTENMASKFNSVVTQFSAKFVNQLEKDKSVVSSPLSAKFLLALLTLGSTGKGHQELLSALGLADDDEIRQEYSNVAKKLKAISGVTLNVANKVYVAEGDYDLQNELKQDAVKVFDAAFEKVNFIDSVNAANLINTWVEGQTNNKIKDLLSPDAFDDMTRLVLVNAIYFKGTWFKKFNPEYTRDQPFYSPGKETQVPMMYIEDKFKYMESEELNAQVLQLPYVGNEASMVIVLPAEVDGLDGVLAKLADGYDLMTDLQIMYSTKVQVSIPKFKIETEIDLNSLLPKIGITKIFSSDSDLTKVLNKKEDLVVSKAVQKAFIEVNEEGAEAAAATAMVMMLCALVQEGPVKQFCADRPFLAMIMLNGAPFFSAVHRG